MIQILTTTAPASPPSAVRRLDFQKIETCHLPLVAHYLQLTDSRTCDYTIGGIYLWVGFFGYELCEADGILLIRGRQENNLAIPAFSLPLGPEESVARAVRLLASLHHPLRFSAIPEDRLHLFAEVGCSKVEELGPDWSDYIYSIDSFATLGGNAMKRKRNHVNRFLADNAGFRFTDIDPAQCMGLLARLGHDGSRMGAAEYGAVEGLLARWDAFGPYMTGRMLTDNSGRVVAFTVGEIKGDTLHTHVEKADHNVSGAGETVAHLFCKEMKELCPALAIVNRQDCAGDSGLRLSKESWRPLRLLPKFNVTY